MGQEDFYDYWKGMLEMLKNVCHGGKTLIVTWKSLDVFWGMKNDGMADQYEKGETEKKIQYNFPKLLSDCLVEIGAAPDRFSVIYREVVRTEDPTNTGIMRILYS